MRFSMKWILAGMAYAAVAAAAFSQQTWVYADILWMASLLAVVYAGLVAVFARGRRQAAAIGFVVGSLAFAACVFAGSSSVPTYRILTAAGLGPDSIAPTPYAATYSAPSPASQPVEVVRMTSNGPVREVRYSYRVVVMPSPAGAVAKSMPAPILASPTPAPAYRPPMIWDVSMYIRAGNAAGTMLFGGLGIVLGLAAYKAARCESDGGAANSPRSLTGG
jgi:hypothetical protein